MCEFIWDDVQSKWDMRPPVRIIWNQIYDLLKLLVAESIDWVIEIDITHNFTNECTNIPMFTNYS